jgi:N,N'-diacetyllegionaminate synthase
LVTLQKINQMNNRVLIIAEAGVNHNGDFETAKKLIDVASDAGADYVKFQTFKANKLVSKTAAKASYQLKNIGDDNLTQYTMLLRLEMPEVWHFDLKTYADKKKIKFLSTGFDDESIDLLEKLGMPLYKVPSGEITNKPYLEHIASKGKPIILSTGMSDLNEIKNAMNLIIAAGISSDMITILHCNSEYPTPMTDVNLLAMHTIKNELNVKVGYSDHTLGIEVPIAAVALGANIIEKHFTLDRTMDGPDHCASLEPRELKDMITAIRNIELAIAGNGIKEPSLSEIKNKIIVRKSIHLKHACIEGHVLNIHDLEMKRPGDGISPMQLDQVIGKRLKKNIPAEHKLTFNDLHH